VKSFRQLRTFLQKELPAYAFTGNIVENNMDYAYFQFTNEDLQSKGLKIVIVFVHSEFAYQIWLSGVNRKIQREYYEKLNNKSHPYTLTKNPERTDYILKATLIGDWNALDVEEMQRAIKANAVDFINQMHGI